MMVDLPAPVAPTTAKVSPAETDSETSCSTGQSGRYPKVTWSNSINGAALKDEGRLGSPAPATRIGHRVLPSVSRS